MNFDFKIKFDECRYVIKYKFSATDKYSGKSCEVVSETSTCKAERAMEIVAEMTADKNYTILEVVINKNEMRF